MAVAFATIFMLLSVVSAVGTSTGGVETSPKESGNKQAETPAQQPSSPLRESPASPQALAQQCASLSTPKERIRCRLTQRTEGLNITEESCRALPNPANCQSLYARVASCYALQGTSKDQCFKRIASFGTTSVASEAAANNKAALRTYAVFLLYDLQEKVEEAHAAQRIGADDAATLIARIVELKQALLLNKPKADIQPLVQQLKTQWRSFMQ